MTGKLSFSAIRNMTVLIVARRVKRHLTAQHQDEEFEQQGEAIEPPGKVRLDQLHIAVGQLHERPSVQ